MVMQPKQPEVQIPVFEEVTAPGAWRLAGWRELQPAAPAEKEPVLRFRFVLLDREVRLARA
jgi:hypothetical protein